MSTTETHAKDCRCKGYNPEAGDCLCGVEWDGSVDVVVTCDRPKYHARGKHFSHCGLEWTDEECR